MKLDEILLENKALKEKVEVLEKENRNLVLVNKRLNHQIAGLKTNNRELTIERNRITKELQQYKMHYTKCHNRAEEIRRKAIGGMGK